MSFIFLIIETAFNIVLVAIIARFLAQMARADFYNPLAQTVVKISSPFVNPLRKIIPSIQGLDTASLIAVLLGQFVFAMIILALSGTNPVPFLGQLLAWSVIGMGSLILDVIKWSMFIVAISSFILMGQHNPFVAFIGQMIEPFVGPFRRLNLQVGMLDLSFLLAFFVLMFLNDFLLIQVVGGFLNYPAQLFVG